MEYAMRNSDLFLPKLTKKWHTFTNSWIIDHNLPENSTQFATYFTINGQNSTICTCCTCRESDSSMSAVVVFWLAYPMSMGGKFCAPLCTPGKILFCRIMLRAPELVFVFFCWCFSGFCLCTIFDLVHPIFAKSRKWCESWMGILKNRFWKRTNGVFGKIGGDTPKQLQDLGQYDLSSMWKSKMTLKDGENKSREIGTTNM